MNKRLVKRENIKVEFLMPDGTKAYDIHAGSNLRGEMIRLGVPVCKNTRRLCSALRKAHGFFAIPFRSLVCLKLGG